MTSPIRRAGKAVPYGIYDLAANAGWVSVGTDHDTAAFAVESIRRWWNAACRAGYPRARRLLITADAGGSNGYRARAWKAGIADLARETGLQITVCHFPPGTSKWNKIEHRLFSQITMNWRGRPLTSHEVIVQAIAATTTAAGLTVTPARHRHLPHGGESQRQGDGRLTPGPPPVARRLELHPAPAPAAPRARRARARRAARPLRPGHPDPPRPDRDLPPPTWSAWPPHWPCPGPPGRKPSATSGAAARGARPPEHTGRPALDLTSQIAVTLIHQHLHLPQHVIAWLTATSPDTISTTIKTISPLLPRHPARTTPAPPRLRTPGDLIRYATAAGITLPPGIKPAC